MTETQEIIKEDPHRHKFGVVILIDNLGIVLLIILLYFGGGFTFDDMKQVLQILIPIKSIYMTAFVKYIIANKHETLDQGEKSLPLSKLYRTGTNIIVCHIALLMLSIILYASNFIPNLDVLKTVIAFIETFFGGYAGLIIADMFRVEE